MEPQRSLAAGTIFLATASLVLAALAVPLRAQEPGHPLDPAQNELLERNERAVRLMGEDKGTDAEAVFKEMPFERLDPTLVPLVRYNYGRVLESVGRLDDAQAQFRLSFKSDPSFHPAADGIYRMILKQGTADAAAEFAGELAAAGQASVAAEQMKLCLQRWPSGPQNQTVLNALIRSFAAASITPQEYRRVHAPALGEMVARQPDLAEPLAAIGRAFLFDEQPAALAQGQDGRHFQSACDPRAMAALLKSVGAYYARRASSETGKNPAQPPAAPLRVGQELRPRANKGISNAEMALLRYSAAWQLDSNNTDAAVYCAALLRDPDKKLDPTGRRREQFIDQIFYMKGSLYDQWRTEGKTHGDELFRLHVILGTIFTEDKAHRPRHTYETPLFQWTQAAYWQEQLHDKPDFTESPEVYLNLADAEVNAKEGTPNEHLLKAAELAARQKNPARTRDALQKMQKYQLRLSPEQKARFDQVNRLATERIREQP